MEPSEHSSPGAKALTQPSLTCLELFPHRLREKLEVHGGLDDSLHGPELGVQAKREQLKVLSPVHTFC